MPHTFLSLGSFHFLFLSHPPQHRFWAETPSPSSPAVIQHLPANSCQRPFSPSHPCPHPLLARTPSLDPQVVFLGRDPSVPAPPHTHFEVYTASLLLPSPPPRPPQLGSHGPPASCQKSPSLLVPSCAQSLRPSYLTSQLLSAYPFLHVIPRTVPSAGWTGSPEPVGSVLAPEHP